MNPDRAPDGGEKRTLPAEQVPRASRPTHEILTRLMATEPRNLRADSYLLEELLSSLRKDQIVLQSLQDDLRRNQQGDLPAELVSSCLQRCCQLELEGEVIGANVALRCGAPEKASVLLQRVIRQQALEVPEVLHPPLFTLLVSLAWVVADRSTAESSIRAARLMDPTGRHMDYLEGVKRLLEARSELQAGSGAAAVRICQMLEREARPEDPLKVLALELQSDAFRELGDLEREQKVLEDWENSLRSLPNGPCDLAVAAETNEASPGISGGARSEEILLHYSRLAILYEGDPGTREYAKGIYTKFLNTAYHGWIDPSTPDAGSIEQRLAQLNPAPTPRPKETPETGLVVIEPDRAYGRVTDSAIEALLEDLKTRSDSDHCAVVIALPDMKERQFRVGETQRSALDQLLDEILQVLREGPGEPSTFEPHMTPVVWKGQPTDWIHLAHRESAPELQRLSFGLRVDRVGNQMDIMPYLLATYRLPLESAAREELAGLLRKKAADLGGYNALQSMLLDLVKRAARRVEQKAGRDDSAQNRGGPIRL